MISPETPFIDADRYMRATNNGAFHPTGADAELIAKIAYRPGTVILDGIPVTTPATNVPELFNPDKTIKLCGEGAHVALVTLEHIATIIDALQSQLGKTPLLAELELDGNGDLTSSATETLRQHGVSINKLLHPRFRTAAAYALYRSTLTPPSDAGRSNTSAYLHQVSQVEQSTRHGKALLLQPGGTFTPKQRDEMWDVFRTRFEEIAPNMPVNLAETREATEELFADPNNLFVYVVDTEDRIACCALGTDNPASYPWINQTFIARLNGPEPTHNVFVPGVARRKDAPGGMGLEVIYAMTEAIVSTGHPSIALSFECTDVSERSIPRGANTAAERLKGLGKLAAHSTICVGRKEFVSVTSVGNR